MKKLFTERHGGLVPRVKEELDEITRKGLMGLIEARIDEEWFGDAFPSMCPDGRGNGGCDKAKLETMIKAYGVIWPGDLKTDWRRSTNEQVPTDGQVFDLVEFSRAHFPAPRLMTFIPISVTHIIHMTRSKDGKSLSRKQTEYLSGMECHTTLTTVR